MTRASWDDWRSCLKNSARQCDNYDGAIDRAISLGFTPDDISAVTFAPNHLGDELVLTFGDRNRGNATHVTASRVIPTA